MSAVKTKLDIFKLSSLDYVHYIYTIITQEFVNAVH
jgi:hypothetical protein